MDEGRKARLIRKLAELCDEYGHLATAEACLALSWDDGRLAAMPEMVLAPLGHVRKAHRDEAMERIRDRWDRLLSGSMSYGSLGRAYGRGRREELPVRKVYGDAWLPDYPAGGCQGLPLRAHSVSMDEKDGAGSDGFSIQPWGIVSVNTGIAAAIPDGCTGFIVTDRPIAGTGVQVAGGVAILNSGYRGQVIVALQNCSMKTARLPFGKPVALLYIVECRTPAPSEAPGYVWKDGGEEEEG